MDMLEGEGVHVDLAAAVEEEVGQRIGLERDMQAALRIEIAQLDPGLTIIDDGAERSVDSGFIDITARDASGTTVVIELKAGKFKPEYAGKLNFYLSAVDAQLKRPDDNSSIGILLCKKKDKIEVEYSLKDINKPIGVSDYLLTHVIPDNLLTKLPTIAELEDELATRIKAK